jgi:hypothetical protein
MPAQQTIAFSAGGSPQAAQTIAFAASGGYSYRARPPVTPSQPVFKVEQNAADMAVYQELDVSQSLATPGETLPIAFGRRENDLGGLWLSPKLVNTACEDFKLSYLYVISSGEIGTSLSSAPCYVGKRNALDVLAGFGPVSANRYSNSTTVCPIDVSPSLNMSCDVSTYYYYAGDLGVKSSDAVSIRTYGNLVTAITLRFKIYGFGTTTAERYQYTYKIRDNNTGTTTTTTKTLGGATGTINTITETGLTASNYTIILSDPVQTVNDTGEIVLFSVEAEQTQTSATSLDYTAQYVDTTFASITGTNMSRLDELVELTDTAGNKLEFRSRDPLQSADLKQIHYFIDAGLQVARWSEAVDAPGGGITTTFGSSRQFLDLVAYVLQYSGLYPGGAPFDFIINLRNLTPFFNNYSMFYNGVVESSTNFLSYLQQVSPYFLLSFYGDAFEIFVQPLLPLTSTGFIDTGALSTVFEFTDLEQLLLGTITPGTYRKVFSNATQLTPFTAVMVYREQNPSYPEAPKTVSIRYDDYPEDAPEEEFDMSEFCCSRDHAILIGKYLLAVRRYQLFSVEFETTRNVEIGGGNALDINGLFSVELSRVNSIGDSRVEKDFFLLESKTIHSSGGATIRGRHFPLDGADEPIISNSIVSGSFVISN